MVPYLVYRLIRKSLVSKRAAVKSTNLRTLPLAGKTFKPGDFAIAAIPVLMSVVFVAFCSAAGTWPLAGFGQPSTYVEDPTKSDIMWTYALMKAGTEGDATPFFWKTVRRLNAPFEAN